MRHCVFVSAAMFAGLASALPGCAAQAPGTSTPAQVATAAASEAKTPEIIGNDEHGGLLYDRWWAEESVARGFVPDDPATPGVADGQGGPNGNGTLNNANGRPLLNDSGHYYRAKSFFGWDLAGRAGIYGPDYHAKPDASSINLLDPAVDDAAIATLLDQGSETTPAFGAVLNAQEMADLLAFVVHVRNGTLARPEQIYALSAATPGNYRLLPGAQVAVGHELFADRCSGCHGADGTDELFGGGRFSLGTHARQMGYEDWAMILSGHPDSAMERQVDSSLSGSAQAREILNLLAALCDRTIYPRGAATADDVAQGDPRCGDYLK